MRTHHGSLPIHFAAYLGNIEIFDLLYNKSNPTELTETDQQGNVSHLIFKFTFIFFFLIKDSSSFCCCN